jgi:hypothetical protein
MISNLLCCLIFRQLHTCRMLNRIVDRSNNLCIVCFLCFYENNISLFSILRYHIGSTDISPCLFILKKILHYITSIRIVLPIQLYTHRLKRIISFSSHNQQSQRTRIQKQRKTKYQIAKTKQISQKLNKYLLEVIRLLQKQKNYRNKTQIPSCRN